MAKANKTSQGQKPAAEGAAKKPAVSKPTAAKKTNKPVGASASAAPIIDTSLAAAAAAKMVANRDVLASSGDKRESNSFKQLKESISKPATGPASFLHSSGPQKKSNLPFSGRNQVGHNQTFGADVNRSGVPRRTGG